MVFKNKKILLICKETFSYPLYFLAQKWKNENIIGAYFFMPAECMYSPCALNSTTYYKYKQLEGIQVFDVCKIANDFTNNKEKPPIKYSYIKELEKKYTYYKELNMQLMSSQFTTRQYHFRNYMQLFTHEQLIYWLQLNYERTIEILEEFKPDIIIDYDDSELPRSIINEVAYKKKIPYITIEHPRFENYKLPTYKMGIGVDKYFINEYKKQLIKSDDLYKEMKYINEFREKNNIMPDEYKNTITSNYEQDNIYTTMKKIYGQSLYFIKQDLSGKNWRLKRKNPLIYPNSWEYIKFYFRVLTYRRKLCEPNKYFEVPIQGEKYVYMPLHLIPESTTFVKAPMYTNELEIISAISKSLPIDWKLYVKEHQAMLGERGSEFYKRIKKFPNVRLVQFNYYNDPKPWIINSIGVVTITGTGAYEAALLGKKSLVFGDVPFMLIDGIERVHSFEELPNKLKNLQYFIDNKKSCAAYIAAVKNVGKDIKYKYLMSEGENILFNRSKITKKYLDEIEKLEEFYGEAYERYKKGKI